MRLNIFRLKYILFFFTIVFPQLLHAQFDIGAFNRIKEEYPNDNIIKLDNKIKLIIEVEKDKLDIHLINKERILYLKNTKGIDPERSIFTSKFKELINFEANTYVLNRNIYKKVPVKTYKAISNFDNDVFYDDFKELIFTFPGIAEGSVIQLNTEYEIYEPRFLNSFFLNDFVPVHNLEIVIECDENVVIDFFEQHISDGSMKMAKSYKKNKVIYSINMERLKNISFEKLQPDRRYFAPHIIPIIRSYKSNGKEFKVLEGIGDLNKWYHSFIANLYDGVDHTEFKRIIGEELSDDMTELEKVERLYYWVQKNIKYIAFENGMEGFIPRKPDEVLKKRYGDCKDKSSLLHALLKECGINSYYTWIGSRDIPYKFSEISSPIVDNHMIVTYINNGDYYFLDATGSYQRINIPTSFIQGKEALINIDEKHYEIQNVPVMKPNQNLVIDSVWISLNENMLLGKGSMTVTGLPKVKFLNVISIDDKEDQKESLESILQKGSNKFVLSNYKLPHDEKFSKEYSFTYDFNLDDYARVIGHEIYLNLNLNRYWLKYKLEEDRKNSLELRNTLTLINSYILQIPEGWKVTYLPSGTSYEYNGCSYSFEYDQNNDEINYTQKVVVDKILIEKKEFANWNNFISSMEKIYKETILIEKIAN